MRHRRRETEEARLTSGKRGLDVDAVEGGEGGERGKGESTKAGRVHEITVSQDRVATSG